MPKTVSHGEKHDLVIYNKPMTLVFYVGGDCMIPLKIETLLEGQVVEQNRVEYKEGWNPRDIIHTICAFANDYDNVNGGYIVIGVTANDGIPLLPPKGVEKEQVDSIQQEIFQYCNRIEPRYIPTIVSR